MHVIEGMARFSARTENRAGGETTPGTGLVAYKTLVEEGKAASLKLGEVNWILGELASKVEKRYVKRACNNMLKILR